MKTQDKAATKPKPDTGELRYNASQIQISCVNNAYGKETQTFSISQVLQLIKEGAYREEMQEIGRIYQCILAQRGKEDAKKAVAMLKQQLPGLLWSGVFERRVKDEPVREYSHIICADLDDLEPARLEQLRALLADDPHVLTAFVSPTLTGLKVLFAVAGGPEQHLQNFLAVQQYVRRTYDIEIDRACKDIQRLCFMSCDAGLLPWRENVVSVKRVEERQNDSAFKKAEAKVLKRDDARPAQEQQEEERPDLELRRKIADEFFAEQDREIDWETVGDGITGYLVCPNIERHTTGKGFKDCMIKLDGVPNISCVHAHCQPDKNKPGKPGALQPFNRELRRSIDEAETLAMNDNEPPNLKEVILLPGSKTTISESARQAFKRIGPSKTLFCRGGQAVEIIKGQEDGKPYLSPVDAQGLRSRVEKHGRLMEWRQQDGKPVLRRAHLSVDIAKALLASVEMQDHLPPIVSVVTCPIVTERHGQLEVLDQGYYRDFGGIFVKATGKEVCEMSLAEAKILLERILQDFDFVSPGDHSRAMAALITPALRLGNLIQNRIPVIVAEANDSQAGKGHLVESICALYGEKPNIVAKHDGGVGSVDELFAAAALRGTPFISFDNARGRIDSQLIESFVTAPGLYNARAFRQSALVDPRRYILMLTSNGAETTSDLAKRCSFIRIRKHCADYVFKDTLGEIREDHTLFLGAVTSVIMEWFRQGKQRTNETRHDFREWCQISDWIVQHLLGAAPLMDDHQEAQQRAAEPVRVWLRAMALALQKDNRLNVELSATGLADLCEDAAIPIPHLRSANAGMAVKVIGGNMRREFEKSPSGIKLEGFIVTREQIETDMGSRVVKPSNFYTFEALNDKSATYNPCNP